MRPYLTSKFSDLERYLGKYDGKYFIDDTPRSAEFALFHHLDLAKKLEPFLLSNFTRLMQFFDDIQGVDAISEYLQKRPELVDVGVEPKLIIDGSAHPTGMQKT